MLASCPPASSRCIRAACASTALASTFTRGRLCHPMRLCNANSSTHAFACAGQALHKSNNRLPLPAPSRHRRSLHTSVMPAWTCCHSHLPCFSQIRHFQCMQVLTLTCGISCMLFSSCAGQELPGGQPSHQDQAQRRPAYHAPRWQRLQRGRRLRQRQRLQRWRLRIRQQPGHLGRCQLPRGAWSCACSCMLVAVCL
jgi:hypothetical protein